MWARAVKSLLARAVKSTWVGTLYSSRQVRPVKNTHSGFYRSRRIRVPYSVSCRPGDPPSAIQSSPVLVCPNISYSWEPDGKKCIQQFTATVLKYSVIWCFAISILLALTLHCWETIIWKLQYDVIDFGELNWKQISEKK